LKKHRKVATMRTGHYYLATLTLVGLALCGLPATADPIIPVFVSNVQADWSQGEGTTTNEGGIYYAGPIIFTVAGTPTIVWCDDLNNVVYIGSSNQYYQTDASDANAYLYNPSLTPPQQITVDQDIAGLAYEGTILAEADGLTSTLGAENQVAIWEVEYPGLTDADTAFQSGVDELIGQAPADYNAMLTAGYAYGELESPGCGQVPGTITYSNGCQTQGQIFVNPDPVPEPLTLSLFSTGLVGAIAVRRRRK
jgi:PEP-CTERM motif